MIPIPGPLLAGGRAPQLTRMAVRAEGTSFLARSGLVTILVILALGVGVALVAVLYGL